MLRCMLCDFLWYVQEVAGLKKEDFPTEPNIPTNVLSELQ